MGGRSFLDRLPLAGDDLLEDGVKDGGMGIVDRFIDKSTMSSSICTISITCVMVVLACHTS